MSDYLINPEVVFGCRDEITNLCDGGLQREGRTLHCLMEHAKENNKLGKSCIKAVSCEALSKSKFLSCLWCHVGIVYCQV